MPVDPKLLQILCCPVTKQPVSPLDREEIDRLNALIGSQDVLYVDGSKVDTPLDEALITENRRTIYRVDDDIPIMLEEQSIPTEQLGDW